MPEQATVEENDKKILVNLAKEEDVVNFYSEMHRITGDKNIKVQGIKELKEQGNLALYETPLIVFNDDGSTTIELKIFLYKQKDSVRTKTVTLFDNVGSQIYFK